MKPLEIKFKVATPVAQAPIKKSFPLHLDALMIATITKGKSIYPLELPDSDFKDPYAPINKALPLAVTGKTKPIYCASAAFCEERHPGSYTYIRQPPEIEVWNMTTHKEYRRGSEKSGKRKAFLETVYTTHPETIIFQCRGDKLEIHDILSQVRNIGYKYNTGFGEVIELEINEIDNKYAGLITADWLPARALPVVDWEYRQGWHKLKMAYQAPYWEPSNFDICWCPDFTKTYPNVG